MKVNPTPTSPKYQVSQQTGPKVWAPGELQRPIIFPYGRVILLVILFSLIIVATTIAGLAWAIKRYPHSWLTSWVPTSSTTVVEKTPVISNGKIPSAVSQAAKTLYGLAIDQASAGLYLPGNITGLAAPLSNNGWLVTLGSAEPSGDNKLIVLPALGQPLTVNLQVTDPASPFIFLKTNGLDQSPVTIGTAGQFGDDGLSVWVVSQVLQQTTISARHLFLPTTTTWSSADRQELYWQLDQDTTQPVGSAVLDQDGHFIGLLGERGHVWPLAAIEPILKELVQSGTIDRPWLGLSYVDLAAVTVVDQPTAAGLQIGGPGGTAAIKSKSPAEKAGLKAGDILTGLAGQPIGHDLFVQMLGYHPGDSITLTYERATKKKEVTIKLGVLRP